jgi:rRNA-processing protein FCF1
VTAGSKSFVDRLRADLDVIEGHVADLIDASTIEEIRNDAGSGVIWVGPTHYWGRPDERQKRLQMPLLEEYRAWYERLSLLLRTVPGELRSQIEETHAFVLRWIEKESDWSIPAAIQEANAVFTEHVQPFRAFLALFDTDTPSTCILVPDTNALIATPDPWSYRSSVGSSQYKFVILPTVLEELDRLKMEHRDPDFRQKVGRVVTRLKGLRSQGDILAGVTVHKTVVVHMIAAEPRFDETLQWLDPTNRDDRILAGALEIQRGHPAATVILVTGDLNLQNKAAMAGMSFRELPAKQVSE